MEHNNDLYSNQYVIVVIQQINCQKSSSTRIQYVPRRYHNNVYARQSVVIHSPNKIFLIPSQLLSLLLLFVIREEEPLGVIPPPLLAPSFFEVASRMELSVFWSQPLLLVASI